MVQNIGRTYRAHILGAKYWEQNIYNIYKAPNSSQGVRHWPSMVVIAVPSRESTGRRQLLVSMGQHGSAWVSMGQHAPQAAVGERDTGGSFIR